MGTQMMLRADRIIDVNASVGHWPFRVLSHNTPQGLVELMDTHGIAQAWVASLDCVLNREMKTANLAFAEAVDPHRDRLLPCATVNPNFPDWESDVDLYLRELGMAGIRTYPNYHGYCLQDTCFGELLDCARQEVVPLQVAVRVTDERMHHPLMKVPAVDLAGMQSQLERADGVSIVLLNVRNQEFSAAARLAEDHPGIFIEISHVEFIGGVARLFERFPEDQVLFGSHAPLLYPLSAVYKLQEADLTEEQLGKLGAGNAARLTARL
jgi:predicted TIM-barrel fold metal-dependent hydrolase